MALTTTTTTITIAAFLFLFLLNPSFSDAQDRNILYSGRWLRAGEFLQTPLHTLVMQADCNLVLYVRDDGPIWASNTGGLASNCRCMLGSDGNLVIYTTYGGHLWATNTSGESGNYVLTLQANRDVVIYGPARWSTGTGTGINPRSSKRGGVGAMDVISITNLPSSSVIYMDGIDLAKNVTTGLITTRAGRLAKV